MSAVRLPFIRPLSPSASVRPPQGDDWLHEPKWDGFRFQAIKDDAGVRFYSRHGAEYTDRLPRMCEAFAKLPTQSAILDGELVRSVSGRPRKSTPFWCSRSNTRNINWLSSGATGTTLT